MLSGTRTRKRKRNRTHGFLRRRKGSVIKKRMRKGRKRLTV